MLELPFVRDERLRQSLQSDLREEEAAYSGRHWKSSITLSGSILEAVVLDALLTRKVKPARSKALDEMTLGELLDEASKAGLLDPLKVKVGEAVKDFRNLVHPGRERRLRDPATEAHATMSRALLKTVTEELERKLFDRARLTAQEVCDRIMVRHDEQLTNANLIEAMWEHDRLVLVKDFLCQKAWTCLKAIDPRKPAEQRTHAEIATAMFSGFTTGLRALEPENRVLVIRAAAHAQRRGENIYPLDDITPYMHEAEPVDQTTLATLLAEKILTSDDDNRWSVLGPIFSFLSVSTAIRLASDAHRDLLRTNNRQRFIHLMQSMYAQGRPEQKEAVIKQLEAFRVVEVLATGLESMPALVQAVTQPPSQPLF